MSTDVACPRCYQAKHQLRDGRTPAGSQRYRCGLCRCRYTPFPKDQGYDEEVRFQALQLYLEGYSMREISRRLDVNHQSIANWMKAYARYLPPDLPPDIAELARLEGLFIL
ncbi:MAG: IS1 family transposase [Anaerolineales bacterium]|uniref:terminase gpP N-terminus-related DNA-binding protein n=1 Tax=Promineifilum sp. TaxID=2664178 RepID=UPI001D3C90E9|nr:IS1 family transposase [Anaerolineales bacterium]MCB8936182.1 IS1 family transposase [Promineifilum sp.]MCO5178642.1 helix-turn-helix domain-containing protein [Promineifilum sp.]